MIYIITINNYTYNEQRHIIRQFMICNEELWKSEIKA